MSATGRAAGLVGLALLGAQPGPARYTAKQLACASYHEVVLTEVRSVIGTVERQERAGRDGMLSVRATATDSGLALLAWYDSLAVWREGPEGRITPDTEGLLGGRWRGLLAPTGRYARSTVPFIPDEVAEIADLRGLLDDFLPVLPDSALPDGSEYRWSRRSAGDSTAMLQDTLAVPVHRESEETGSLTWDALRGPVDWERTIRLTARIPPGGAFRRGLVTVVTQRVRVERRECGTGKGATGNASRGAVNREG